MGKLLGICLLGLTQLGIWLGTVLVLTAPGIVAALPILPAGVSCHSLSASMVINFVLLFILGFLAYATLYAVIGASFNNVQEAQQAAGIADGVRGRAGDGDVAGDQRSELADGRPSCR